MARLGERPPRVRGDRVARDDRGAVYVEFLIVFMPLFVLFLAICQLALLAAARLVVQHAALSGARSAIVVLEDDPAHYAGVARGWLSLGPAMATPGLGDILGGLGITTSSSGSAGSGLVPTKLQQGSRMSPVRAAADFPLLALAPSQDSVARPEDGSVAASLASNTSGQIAFALAYTRAAAVITVHTDDSDSLAPEPVPRNAAVNVRVTYLYSCGVPVVRALICRTLDSLLAPPSGGLLGLLPPTGTSNALAKRLELAEDAGGLKRLSGAGAYFAALTAEATLPNQGAAYEHAADK